MEEVKKLSLSLGRRELKTLAATSPKLRFIMPDKSGNPSVLLLSILQTRVELLLYPVPFCLGAFFVALFVVLWGRVFFYWRCLCRPWQQVFCVHGVVVRRHSVSPWARTCCEDRRSMATLMSSMSCVIVSSSGIFLRCTCRSAKMGSALRLLL